MPVDKFGRSGKDVRVTTSGVSINTISNIFVRRDGSNSIIGVLNVTGNKITNVGEPVLDQDVATKGYVDTNTVSKSGDTMTGNLFLTPGSDEGRILGCADLAVGKSFSVFLGNQFNQLHFTMGEEEEDADVELKTPVTLDTEKGFLVKMNRSDIIQLGPRITAHKDVNMNDFRIRHLAEPTSRHEAATKNYVDSRKPIITIWAEANGPMEGDQYEWSFGAGSEGRGHRRSGYTMLAQGRILRMGMSTSSIGNPPSSNTRCNIVINGREQEQYYTHVLAGQYSGTTVFDPPLRLNQGDRINFISHNSNPTVCCAVVDLLIELDL